VRYSPRSRRRARRGGSVPGPGGPAGTHDGERRGRDRLGQGEGTHPARAAGRGGRSRRTCLPGSAPPPPEGGRTWPPRPGTRCTYEQAPTPDRNGRLV